MVIKSYNNDALFAFLILLPTFYGINQYSFILTVMYVLVKYTWDINLKLSKTNTCLLALILVLSVVNYYVLGGDKIVIMRDWIAYFLIYYFCFLIASKITQNTLKFIYIFIAIEAIFVLLEHFMGINTIFLNHIDFRNDLYDVGIYSARPFGLSSGISTAGLKLGIGFIIYYFLLNKNNIYFRISNIIILIAIYYNYVRSVHLIILAIVFYELLIGKDRIKFVIIFLSIFFFSMGICGNCIPNILDYKDLVYLILMMSKWTLLTKIVLEIINLTEEFFARIKYWLYIIYGALFLFFGSNCDIDNGRNKTDILSYRDELIYKSCKFIENNIFMGNNSHKYYVYLDNYKVYEHTHNSFLQILTTHGGLFFFYIYFLFIRTLTEKIKRLL